MIKRKCFSLASREVRGMYTETPVYWGDMVALPTFFLCHWIAEDIPEGEEKEGPIMIVFF